MEEIRLTTRQIANLDSIYKETVAAIVEDIVLDHQPTCDKFEDGQDNYEIVEIKCLEYLTSLFRQHVKEMLSD